MSVLLQHALELASDKRNFIAAPVKNRVAYIIDHAINYSKSEYSLRTHGIAEALNEHGLETLCFVKPGMPFKNGNMVKVAPFENIDNVRYIHGQEFIKDSSDVSIEEASEKLVEILKVYRPEKVLAASDWTVALPAWIASKRLGLPFYYDIRNFLEISKKCKDALYEGSSQYQLDFLNEIFVEQQADGLIVSNENVKQELVRRGVHQQKINLVASALSYLPEKISRQDKAANVDDVHGVKKIAYLGSANDEKAVELITKACSELNNEGHTVSLIPVNKSHGVEGYEGAGVFAKELYETVDLCVISASNNEISALITPHSLIEALSFDKKVLISNQVPAGDLVHLNNVYEFVLNDLDSLKSMIVKALKVSRYPKNRNLPLYKDEVKGLLASFTNFNKEDRSDSDAIKLANAGYIYNQKGCESVVKFLSEGGVNKKSYFNASNYFKSFGLYFIAGDIIEDYLNKNKRDTATLKALFWIKQKEMDFESCHKIVNEIESLSQIDSKELGKLRKAYGSYSFLKVFDSIKNSAKPAYTPKSKRVCYLLHNSLPYSSGGYATRADGVAQGLKNSGYEVIILTRPGFPIDIKPELKNTDFPLAETISGVEYRRILKPDRKSSAGVDYIQKSTSEIEKEFRKLKPEVVVAASNHITAIPALLAAKKLGIPFIYEVRGFWEVTRLSREPEYKKTTNYNLMVLYEALTARYADHVFTLTEPMREELINRGVEREKITLLPNSCDPTRFTPRSRDQKLAQSLNIPNDVPVIGYIGSFVIYEGLEHLAEACGILKRKGVQFRLLIVGNENTSGSERGPITKEIQDIAQEMGFSDWLIMPGRVPHEEVESYYSLIDVAPFPRKPWPVCEMVSPMKPLEALAMEKAVIVSSVRALVEMVKEGETGLVFNKGSIESLADCLEKMISSPDLRLKLGKAGRLWVENERTWNASCQIADSRIQSIKNSFARQ